MADLESDQVPRRRGRPKGTGIDDSTLLRQINGLMAADKSLKPTTAIKQCGIENPSIVRRLREKLKSSPAHPPRAGAAPSAHERSVSSKSKPAARQAKATAGKPASRSVAAPQAPSPPQSTQPTSELTPADAATKDAQKAREASLLAAYLKALQQTAVPSLDEERLASRQPQEPPPRQPISPEPPPRPQAQRHFEPQHASPPNPFAAFQPPPTGAPPPAGMMFPFFPPFMQPFAPKAPPPNPMLQNQMEALKLSVEVMTAVTKLQMFAYQNTLAATPFGNMLQAQTMMGQMLLASFAGFAGLGRKPDGSK